MIEGIRSLKLELLLEQIETFLQRWQSGMKDFLKMTKTHSYHSLLGLKIASANSKLTHITGVPIEAAFFAAPLL
jgi:hypothetical protein